MMARDSYNDEGLPDWMMSRQFILFVAVVVVIVLRYFVSPISLMFFSQNSTMPCFQLIGTKAFVPKNLPYLDRQKIYDNKSHRIEKKLAKILDGISKCPIDNCAPIALKYYTSGIRNYIIDRAHDTHSADLFHGDEGLKFVRDLYSSYTDRLVVKDFKKRVQSGQVRLIRQKDFIRVLLAYDPEEVRACHADDFG